MSVGVAVVAALVCSPQLFSHGLVWVADYSSKFLVELMVVVLAPLKDDVVLESAGGTLWDVLVAGEIGERYREN